uniref:Secreted protein n=1 Tax=Setaria viridis TaxID=4556 RepID=A0A4U6T425_SETVI|nr:hypothetical protein SEVIR_9G427566v2 [Setaria viridis]
MLSRCLLLTFLMWVLLGKMRLMRCLKPYCLNLYLLKTPHCCSLSVYLCQQQLECTAATRVLGGGSSNCDA